MKTKIFGGFLALSLLSTSVSPDLILKNYHAAKLNPAGAALENFKHGFVPLPGGIRLNLLNANAAGEDVGDASCNEIIESAWNNCEKMWLNADQGGYDHGALKYFNNTLCWINSGAPADAENVLCHFNKSMGINPDVENLPSSTTATFGDMTVTVSVDAPTEAWALAKDYDFKGSVTVNGDTYMIIYWSGSDQESKGFMIEGDVDGLGGNRASYIMWDLTDSTNQTVRVYKADYPSGSYLGDATQNDHSVYGRVSYNSSTKAVVTQAVLLSAIRPSPTNPSDIGCFKMYGEGVKDGAMVIAKTEDSKGSNGHDGLGLTSLNLTQMDGAVLDDLPGTVNGSGNLSDDNTSGSIQDEVESALGITPGANVFDVSCDDISNAASSGIFSTTDVAVDFDADQDDIFPSI